jgi:hypothetical protein
MRIGQDDTLIDGSFETTRAKGLAFATRECGESYCQFGNPLLIAIHSDGAMNNEIQEIVLHLQFLV